MSSTHSQSYQYFGVDISKDYLDLSGAGGRFPHQLKGWQQLLAAILAQADGSGRPPLVVFEATGGYEKAFMGFLDKQALAFIRINPKRARDYARACGILSKSDRIDASVLADLGLKMNLQPRPQPSAARRRLGELERRRSDLLEMRKAEDCRLQQATDPFILRRLRVHIKHLRREIVLVEEAIEELLLSEQPLKLASQCLQSVSGIGPRVSTVLLADLPELGSLEDRQIVSLAGLAPFARDSGTLRGKRVCYGGRSQVKKSLFQAAIVAARYNPVLQPFYQRLLARGKAKMTALIAVARKLLCYLNRLMKRHLNQLSVVPPQR